MVPFEHGMMVAVTANLSITIDDDYRALTGYLQPAKRRFPTT
jgi:hypothetical protein